MQKGIFMVIKKNSEAYDKGFKSECYENPYQVGSNEYNDCERGWAQRIKRGYRCKPVNSSKQKHKQKTFKEIYQQSSWHSKVING
jgi:hypothetical protein